MDHRIGLKKGQIIRYLNKRWEVVDVYPYIAYLDNLDKQERICVGVGDLVIGGVEPIGRGGPGFPDRKKDLARIRIHEGLNVKTEDD